MKATAEIQVIPIGAGTSVRNEVRKAHEILKEANIHATLHAYGTNVEGEIDAIFAAVKRIHETLHSGGVSRLATFVKLGTRTDKEPSLEAKLF